MQDNTFEIKKNDSESEDENVPPKQRFSFISNSVKPPTHKLVRQESENEQELEITGPYRSPAKKERFQAEDLQTDKRMSSIKKTTEATAESEEVEVQPRIQGRKKCNFKLVCKWILLVFSALSLIGLGGLIYYLAVYAKRANLAN